MNEKLNEHKTTRTILRIIGFIFLPIGLICITIGISNFIISSSNFEDPKLFYLNFIGMPFMFIGSVCLSFGFMKNVNHYVASQQAPINKEVANYMLDGTREELSKTVGSIKQTMSKTETNNVRCPKCGIINEQGAFYCDNCGTPLTKKCKFCGEDNDIDAHYCRHCGKKI